MCSTTEIYLLLFAVWSCVQNVILQINIITNIVVILPVFLCWMQHCPAITLAPSHLLLILTSFCCLTPSSSLCWYITSLPATCINDLTIKLAAAPNHSAPRSWHERDFCLRNLPTSRSRGYRGTRLDRKRLARDVMLSRWPPPLMSSPLAPGGQGGWPLASRTAHSRSSGVRWSSEAEISRYRQLKRAALDMASEGRRE